jgi:hypothetical protein
VPETHRRTPRPSHSIRHGSPPPDGSRTPSRLRHDQGHHVNVKKVHRLWREDGLQVGLHSPRNPTDLPDAPCPVHGDESCLT